MAAMGLCPRLRDSSAGPAGPAVAVVQVGVAVRFLAPVAPAVPVGRVVGVGTVVMAPTVRSVVVSVAILC